MITVIIFILVLGLLIFVHEFGHFIVAKKSGMKVEEFGFGFPPKLFGIKRGDTTYSINLLPIGGFVRILGEDGEKVDDPKSFASRSVGIRAAVISAGVVMNIVLAIFLFIICFKVGIPTVVDSPEKVNVRDEKVQIINISEGSPAQEAGVIIGDSILEIADIPVESVEQVQDSINSSLGKELAVKISRGEEIINLTLKPRIDPPEGEGATGIALVKTGIVSYPWHISIWKGIEATFSMLIAIIVAFAGILKNIFMGQGVSEGLAGPVGIAVMTGQMAKLGFVYILQFTAILSINLAILNFLPFPALDGGRMMFLILEKIRGKKVKKKTENMIHAAGFVILIALMILVTFRDIFKFKDIFINFWERLRG